MLENKKVEQVIKNWLSRISEKNSHIGGNKICPFARLPKIVAVDKLSLQTFSNINDQLTIYMETDVISSYQEIEDLCRQLKKINPNYVFLPDHPTHINLIQGQPTGNGYYPCIIVQTKQELDIARSALQKTDYYTYWDSKYLAEIRSFD